MKNLRLVQAPFLTVVLLLLFSIGSLNMVNAQCPSDNINPSDYPYETNFLPEPDDFFFNLGDKSINYGATPPNSQNKPVLVFNHGYVDGAGLGWFLTGPNMYEAAYNDNYRVVFVNTTSGDGMWVNGVILSEMLEDITAHYGVDDVVLVAHSNGGKASEVALFCENKSHLVDRVITLGTPFKGTPLASLADVFGISLLVEILGLADGAHYSTTHYMENVARPILDNLPNNQPNKFICFGGWGYNRGSTLFAITMDFGGSYLNNTGANFITGGNDGVTPYYSSTRPGGNRVWSGCYNPFGWWCNKDSRIDHIDIAQAKHVWNEMKPYLQGSYKIMNEGQDDLVTIPNDFIESNYEILSTMDGNEEVLTIGKNAQDVNIHLMHSGKEDDFKLLDPKGVIAQTNEIQKIETASSGHNTSILMNQPLSGKYTIESDAEEFIALVEYQNGPKLRFEKINQVLNEGASFSLNTAILGTEKEAVITGVIRQTIDENGQKANEQHIILNFVSNKNGQYHYTFPNGLEEGVYSLVINADGEDYRRTIVSGFVVGKNENGRQELNLAKELDLKSYPSPISDRVMLSFDIVEEGKTTIALFDAYGRLIKITELTDLAIGQNTFEWNLGDLPNGNYFLQLTNNQIKACQPLQIIK